MKIYLLKNRIIKSMMFVGILMLSSCIDDTDSPANSSDGLNTRAEFTLQMPSNLDAITGTTPGEVDENNVQTVDVLAFVRNPNNNAQWIFSYLATGDNIIDLDGNGSVNKSKKQFSVTLKVKDEEQKLVVIANAHNEVVSKISDNDAGVEDISLLARITSGSGSKWDLSTRPFPMWGETTGIIGRNTTALPGIVNMLRSMARVDVVVGNAAQTNFQMTDVYVYKSQSVGNVVPNPTNYSNNVPTIPSNATNNATLQYALPVSPVTTTFQHQMYISEAAAGFANKTSEATAIVVGGLYQGSTSKTYYRIDFMELPSKTYVPVLRNHQYKFVVNSVSKPGKDTPDDAYNAVDVNMNVTVTDWDLADMGDVIFPGEYYIQFRPSREFQFYSETATQIMDVQTTYPEGFKITKYTELGADGITETILPNTGGWISTTPGISAGNGANQLNVPVGITVTKNTNTTSRVGFIYVQVGKENEVGQERLTIKVKVTQSQYQALSLKVSDMNGNVINDLLFQQTTAGTAPASQKFKVTWEPTTESVTVNNEQIGLYPFPSGGATNVPLAGTSLTSSTGTTTFEITPTEITQEELNDNPFLERSSKLTFFVTNAGGTETLQEELTLRQIIPNLITVPVMDSYYNYLLDGGTYHFGVRSNYAWRIADVTQNGVGGFLNDSYGNLKVNTVGTANTSTAGTTIDFKTIKKMTGKLETITVVFASTDPNNPVADKVITINLNGEYFPEIATDWAGSNIYYNGSNLTFDLTTKDSGSAKQGVFFKWGSLWGITPLNNGSDAFSTSLKMFSPDGGSKTALEYGFTSWDNILYVGSAAIPIHKPDNKSDLDRQYLYEITSEEATTGDICQYLKLKGFAPAGNWRMPTATEMGVSTSYVRYPSQGSWPVFRSIDEDGKHNGIAGGYVYSNVYFPAGGFRNETGVATEYGTRGTVWTGSAASDQSYAMKGLYSGVVVASYENRNIAAPVRCVKIGD